MAHWTGFSTTGQNTGWSSSTYRAFASFHTVTRVFWYTFLSSKSIIDTSYIVLTEHQFDYMDT
jgi:hypothetical protein